MDITEKEKALINDWIKLHHEIEKMEEELNALTGELRKISNRLYNKNSKAELEQFRDALEVEIDGLDTSSDKDRIRQLSNLKIIVEHDINIEDLVEQDIDIEEKGMDIDLKDYDNT